MGTNPHHLFILNEIKRRSGVATNHTFLDNYLGTGHPRYPINSPTLREIAKDWSRENKLLSAVEFCGVVDSLIHGPSFTEKVMGGILMDYATKDQVLFDPKIFDEWLDQLEGWAEVDSVCSGKYTIKAIPALWKKWEKILHRFAKSKNIHKRRASLVLLCSPVRYADDEHLSRMAFANIELLKHEKEVLITKAISWLLRSMIKNFKKEVAAYVSANKSSLPSVAVRETLVTLKSGKKTK